MYLYVVMSEGDWWLMQFSSHYSIPFCLLISCKVKTVSEETTTTHQRGWPKATFFSWHIDIPRSSGKRWAPDDVDDGNDYMDNVMAGNHPSDTWDQNLPTMSVSYFGGYKSAILWFYKEHKILMHDAASKYHDEAIDGWTRIIADKNELGVVKLLEGKDSFTFGE